MNVLLLSFLLLSYFNIDASNRFDNKKSNLSLALETIEKNSPDSITRGCFSPIQQDLLSEVTSESYDKLKISLQNDQLLLSKNPEFENQIHQILLDNYKKSQNLLFEKCKIYQEKIKSTKDFMYKSDLQKEFDDILKKHNQKVDQISECHKIIKKNNHYNKSLYRFLLKERSEKIQYDQDLLNSKISFSDILKLYQGKKFESLQEYNEKLQAIRNRCK